MTPNLTDGQKAVLRAFRAFGAMDDVALAVYVHHVEDVDMSSSGIRTRRHELGLKGLLHAVGIKRAKSGRRATIWNLTPEGRIVARRLARQAKRAQAVAA
jgi:hypothetical protein